MRKPKVIVLRTAGTNCDGETAFAFERVGARTELVHINQIIRKEKSLLEYDILAIPGGFTYGDDISAGKILANELKYILREELESFLREKRPIIGICNGFQVLVKAGILPGNGFKQKVTLTYNDSGKFEDRWVYLRTPEHQSTSAPVKCIWTKNLPEIIELPVAHGEGKFVADKEVIEELKKNGQIVFQYVDREGNLAGYPYNPNGSLESIAGICDETGLILGLMPHPERHIDYLQHPRWVRERHFGKGDGLKIFRNGVEYVKKNL
ncbi:MAG: phosphoribosylformylglycinamidine synthase I [Candidatus Omnitrophica bacterium]|nr:phosphoribosylformylglycinamidine synthase I [Candidatus Omnitrophota bacterium]MCM8797860.1 phosphoribosylformylglycinamidine synthase I [Candidatus Omnitrophota bacterium]